MIKKGAGLKDLTLEGLDKNLMEETNTNMLPSLEHAIKAKLH